MTPQEAEQFAITHQGESFHDSCFNVDGEVVGWYSDPRNDGFVILGMHNQGPALHGIDINKVIGKPGFYFFLKARVAGVLPAYVFLSEDIYLQALAPAAPPAPPAAPKPPNQDYAERFAGQLVRVTWDVSKAQKGRPSSGGVVLNDGRPAEGTGVVVMGYHKTDADFVAVEWGMHPQGIVCPAAFYTTPPGLVGTASWMSPVALWMRVGDLSNQPMFTGAALNTAPASLKPLKPVNQIFAENLAGQQVETLVDYTFVGGPPQGTATTVLGWHTQDDSFAVIEWHLGWDPGIMPVDTVAPVPAGTKMWFIPMGDLKVAPTPAIKTIKLSAPLKFQISSFLVTKADDRYPHTCKCGSKCYRGAFTIDCTNESCYHFDGKKA